jgi:putative two-component system response regulator
MINNFKSTILLVDDTPFNLEILKEVLDPDYNLYFADNGHEAIRIAKEEKPDIILLDVIMPEIGGYDVCKILKADADTTHIPIIFITSMSESDNEALGLSIGAVDYIVKPVRPAIVKARVKTHLSLVRMDELKRTRLEIIHRLGLAAEYKDNETGLHVIRMSHYSRILAEGIGWSGERLDDLFNAAPMHDIGKIGIPDSILLKPGKLDPQEWETMKKHPIIGAEIIGSESRGLLNAAKNIALSHHEKWDGTGYPYGLKEHEICIEGRIVAIADVYDALTSARPYKKAWTQDATIEYLQEQSGKHFDPELVPIFLSKMSEVLDIQIRWKETGINHQVGII